MQKIALFLPLLVLLSACDVQPEPEGGIRFKFNFDANQERLNNLGLPATIPAGNAAQSPEFRKMSVHYIELAPTAFTQLGEGAVLYKAPETTKGGNNAIDFDKALLGGQDEVFLELNLSQLPPGTYEWVRASVAYQNYDVLFNINKIPVLGDLKQQRGSIASFVGFNTYISTVTPLERALSVNDDKRQGFWAFETNLSGAYSAYNTLSSGEAPAGATTVVNPLAQSSPIPPGSCVVTGKFATPLVITGDEKGDLTITLSFSVNNSFEWKDDNGNKQLDFYADGQTPGEQIVDMGLRGLIPIWSK